MRTLFVLAAAATFLALDARAEGRTSALSWVRTNEATDCVATSVLAAAVQQELGREVFVSPARADVSVEGLAAREGHHHRITLILRDASGHSLGTRVLQGADDATCDALTPSIVLAIALMIDPDATLAASPASTTTPQPAIPTTQPATPIPPRASPPPRTATTTSRAPLSPQRPWYVELGLEGGLGFGLVESHHGQLGGSLLVRAPFGAAIAAGGAFLPPRDLLDESRARATSIGWLAFFDVCPLVLGSRSSIALLSFCAGARGGALTQRGTQIDQPRRESLAFVGAELALRASLRLVGPLALRASAAALVPFARPASTYDDASGTPHELDRIGALIPFVEVGLGWAFR